MKKLCYSAFIAFWSSIVTLLSIQALATAPAPAEESAATIYRLEEIAGHNNKDSCWMAIDGAVYDLSDYLPQHPAPMAVILSWCGTNATEGMRTKGYGRDHSTAAWRMLDAYKIGELAK